MTKDSRAFLEAFSQELPNYFEGVPHADSGRRGITFEAHQRDQIRAVHQRTLQAIEERRQQLKLSIVAPCGSGKTLTEMAVVLASHAAQRKLDHIEEQPEEAHLRRKSIVITSGRAEAFGIQDQYRDLGYETGRIGGGERQNGHAIIVANIQALQALVARDIFEEVLPKDSINLAVMDEADLHLTEKRKDVKKRMAPHILMGATATEAWPDGRNISEIYGEPAHRMKLMEGIRQRINAKPVFKAYESRLDQSKLRIKKDDYDKTILSGAMREAEIHKAIVEVYRDIVPVGEEKDMPTLVYVPSVELVRQVRDTMQAHLGDQFRVVGWSGEDTDGDELRENMELFKSGDVNVAVMCEIGGRGMNLENARLLIDAFPTLSLNKLEQRHGRVLRRIRVESPLWRKGWRKQNAVIAQILPHANRFRPALFTDLLGGHKGYEHLMRELDLEGGRPEDHADAVSRLRQFIESKKPHIEVELLGELDVYEALRRYDELPQADATGFFYLPRSAAEKLRHEQRQAKEEEQ